MRNILLTSLLLSLCALTFAQTVNYEIIKDAPYEPKISVNLDLFNMDLNTDISNLRLDNISMNLGLFGYVKLIDRLDIDFNVHKSWLTLGKIGYKEYPGNTELNAGGNLWLSKKEVVKNVKVVLKQTQNSSSTTTTFIEAPVKHMKRFGVRGGLYSKTGPFNFKEYSGDDGSSSIEQTKISSFGIYAGVNFRSISNFIIKDDVYGRSFNSGGRDIYFEGLFVPVNRFKDLNNNNANVSETVRDFKTTLPVGFRIGYRTYQVEKKEFTGKKFGMCGIGEFGYKPYQGWFLTAGFGLTLVKN